MLEETLRKLLQTLVEVSVDTGVADATSTVNFLDDSAKNWPPSPGGFENLIVEITGGTGEGQFAKIASNTATRLTFAAAMPVAPDATSTYRIGFFGKMASDITAWGGTALTGRDISLDLKALIDDSIKGVFRSLADIGSAAGEDDMGLLDRIGELKASPTANTVLGRLKGIETAVSGITLAADTPVIYNVTMTNLDTEYSQALPANTKKYTIQTRDGTAFRMAFVTGKVAAPTEPYFSIGTDGFHHEDLIKPASLTLYFACGEAGKVVEIIAWS